MKMIGLIPQDNPLSTLMLRRKRPPSLGATLLLALGVGGLGLVIGTRTPLLVPRQSLEPADAALLIGGGAAVLLGPVIAAILAAAYVVYFTRTETYQLLKLSALSLRDLFNFFIGTILFRMRLVLALVVALTPAFVLGMMHLTLLRAFHRYPMYAFATHRHPLPPPPTGRFMWRVDLLGWTPEFFGWAVGMWGVVLLAVVLAIGLALRWRRPAVAGTAAALIALLVGAALLAGILLLPLERAEEGVRALAVLFVATAPYGLGLGTMALLCREP
jgi:hypothetical protein